MYAVISPAKKLDFESDAPTKKFTQLKYPDKTWLLIQALRKCTPGEVSKMMKLSQPLTELNVKRYKNYKKDFGPELGKQAMFAFNGDTYTGLDATTLNAKEIEYSQKHLGILSGLYGLLSPLDLIQPYRLEMGTRFACDGKKNLYEYWNETVTGEINKILKKEKVLLNLSSNEYFSAIDNKNVQGTIITPVFKEKNLHISKLATKNV